MSNMSDDRARVEKLIKEITAHRNLGVWAYDDSEFANIIASFLKLNRISENSSPEYFRGGIELISDHMLEGKEGSKLAFLKGFLEELGNE